MQQFLMTERNKQTTTFKKLLRIIMETVQNFRNSLRV